MIWNFSTKFTKGSQWKIFKLRKNIFPLIIWHQQLMYQLEADYRCGFWCITFLWDNWCQFGKADFLAFLAIFSISRFGIFRPTKMLCTKIYICNQPPVDTIGYWWQIISRNMFNLNLKIFHWLPLVNLVLKFQIKLGTFKP